MSGAGHPNPVVRHLREGLRSPLPLTRMASSTSRLPRGTCYSVPLVSIAVRQDRAAYRSSTACVPACLRACLLACLPRGFLKPPSAPPRRRLSGFAKPPRPVAIPRHFRETAPPSRYPPPLSRNRPAQSLSPATIPQVSRNRPPSPLSRNRTSRCGHQRCLSSRPPLPSADSCTLSRKRPGALTTVGRRFVFSRRRRDTPFPFRPVNASLSRRPCCPSWRFRESASGFDERGELGRPRVTTGLGRVPTRCCGMA
jgi:hypothetical protein